MTLHKDICLLAKVQEWNDEIYGRLQPVKPEPGQVRALTEEERVEVELRSTERGYRRFIAERMVSV